MLPSLIEAASTLLTWPLIGFVVLGTLIGLVFGALPGLGGVVALSLLIPITFGMDPTAAIVLFAATMGGTAFGGSVSAILINTPGTPPNAATCFDGYPLAQQNRAAEALGTSATASLLGAFVGLIVLVALIPFTREIILSFGPPEFFWLAVLGLTLIGVLTEGSILKGVISGGFGLMVSFIGYSNVTADYRFGFGTLFLWEGIEVIAAFIGIFAIAEIMRLSVDDTTIAEDAAAMSGSVLKGVTNVLTQPILLLRSAAIGVLIGMVPGVGGSVANFIAYGQAVQTSKDPKSFGTGNPSGIIASEAANDAKDGGSLLPALIFAIPGSAGSAILLGGLIFHGVTPGRNLIEGDIAILFMIVLALLFSNILTSLIGLASAKHLARITMVPVRLLIPIILTVSLVGAYATRGAPGDIVVAVVFGFLAFGMVVFDYSRVALVLALILGPIVERYLLQSLSISDSGYWILVNRPISQLLIAIALIGIAIPVIRSRRSDAEASAKPSSVPDPGTVDGDPLATLAPRLSQWLPRSVTTVIYRSHGSYDRLFAALLLLFTGVLVIKSLHYTPRTRLVTLVIGIPTILLLGALLTHSTSFGSSTDDAGPRPAGDEVADTGPPDEGDEARADPFATRHRILRSSVWILALLAATFLFGFLLSIAAYLLAYFRRSADLSWSKTLRYTAVIWLVIVILFEVVLGFRLYDGVLWGLA